MTVRIALLRMIVVCLSFAFAAVVAGHCFHFTQTLFLLPRHRSILTPAFLFAASGGFEGSLDSIILEFWVCCAGSKVLCLGSIGFWGSASTEAARQVANCLSAIVQSVGLHWHLKATPQHSNSPSLVSSCGQSL